MDFLWLDDMRRPPPDGKTHTWRWVADYNAAVEALSTGEFEFASLDHDLAPEHYPWSGIDPKDYRERTGYDVLAYMELHGIKPKRGIRVHTMNKEGHRRMLKTVKVMYGWTFQFPLHPDSPDLPG